MIRLAMAVVLFGGMGPILQARDWTEWPACTWREHASNDGDSFRLTRNGRTYLIRLYFVDTPETDNRYRERVEAQAAYFGKDPGAALALGKGAAAFTEQLLQDKTFKVYTKYADARGSSKLKRYYAMVKIDDRYLCEHLVEAGWARVKGSSPSNLPGGQSDRLMWQRLRALEKTAKAESRGAWGDVREKGGEPEPNKANGQVVEPRTRKLPRAVAVMDVQPPHAVRGTLPAGWEVRPRPSTVPGFIEVSFVTPGGAGFIGLVRQVDVPELGK